MGVTTPETFKQRVDAFWSWFASVHERFFHEIEAGRCGGLQPETSEMTNALLPGFAWVYGPGDEQKGGHSLTLSGEGVLHQQILASHWAARAPEPLQSGANARPAIARKPLPGR